jgi:hypothetical protein
MMRPSGAHTHPSGGGGAGAAAAVVAVFFIVAYVVKYIITPMVSLALDLIKVLVIAGGATVALGVATMVAVVVYRLRHGAPVAPFRVLQAPRVQRPVQARSEPPAVAAPQQLHVHFHGVTAADAEAIRAIIDPPRGT